MDNNKIDREEKIEEYMAVMDECYEKIHDILDDNQIEVFQKFLDNLLNYSKICTEEAFEKGFETAKISTFSIIQTALDILKSK